MRRISLLAACFTAALLVAISWSQSVRADFLPGQYVTYAQQPWGEIGAPASQLLASHVDALYPNGVEIGVPGPAGSSALFTTLQAILDYLPAGGTAAPLVNDELDPTSTFSGRFGGYVLALRFNVDFGDAGLLAGSATLPFGDLVLLDTGFALFDGLTVRRYLDQVNSILGGMPTSLDYEQVADLTDNISLAFENGVPSAFAQDHLAAPNRVAEPTTIGLLMLGVIGVWSKMGRRQLARPPSFTSPQPLRICR